MDNQGVAALARVLQGRTNERFKSNGNVIEFATVTSDYCLKPDASPDMVITKEDYLILESLNAPEKFETLPESVGDHSTHTHEITTPVPLSKIKPGDRVVIAWIGSDAIVLGRYKTGTELINGG